MNCFNKKTYICGAAGVNAISPCLRLRVRLPLLPSQSPSAFSINLSIYQK